MIATSAQRLHRICRNSKTSLYGELVSKGYYLVDPNTARWRWFGGGLFCVIAVGVIMTILTPYGNPLPAIVGGGISLFVLIIGSQAMPKRTKIGSLAHSKVRGFAEFLKRARGDEIDWMARSIQTRRCLSLICPTRLPWASLQKWARRFGES